MREELLSLGCVRAICETGRNHVEREDCAWFACKALVNFSSWSEGQEAVLAAGGLGLYAEALRFHAATSSNVVHYAAKAVAMVAGNQERKLSIFVSNVPALLRPGLSREDPRAVYYALKTAAILGAPTTPQELREQLWSAKWPAGIVDALLRHGTGPGAKSESALAVVGAGLRAIGSLAANSSPARVAFLGCGSHDLVIKLVGEYGASPDVASAGCRALAALLHGSKAQALVVLGGGALSLLLQLLSVHRGDAEVVAGACRGIAECGNHANPEAKVAGAVEAVESAMKAHFSDPLVRKEGKRALEVLTLEASSISSFKERSSTFGKKN